MGRSSRPVLADRPGTGAATRRGGDAINAPHDTRQPADAPAARTRSGPRRSEAARVAVLRAADDLLMDVGFHAMTVSAIAERAGVAKQTIYRWWRSKVAILLDVLEEDLHDKASWPELPDSAQAALEQHVTHLSRVFAQSPTGHVLFVLIGHALHDPTTAAVLRDQVLDRQRQYDRAHVRQALASLPRATVSRNEADQLLDLLVGPAFHRAFTTGQPLDPRFVERLTATVLARRREVPSAAPSL